MDNRARSSTRRGPRLQDIWPIEAEKTSKVWELRQHVARLLNKGALVDSQRLIPCIRQHIAGEVLHTIIRKIDDFEVTLSEEGMKRCAGLRSDLKPKRSEAFIRDEDVIDIGGVRPARDREDYGGGVSLIAVLNTENRLASLAPAPEEILGNGGDVLGARGASVYAPRGIPGHRFRPSAQTAQPQQPHRSRPSTQPELELVPNDAFRVRIHLDLDQCASQQSCGNVQAQGSRRVGGSLADTKIGVPQEALE